jgi:pimeloyl-ACP methyl ester carboxylesterase
VHGWGRSADSVWWQLIEHTERTVVAVDLPGHGRSILDHRFSFALAAESVRAAISDAGLVRPILVGHSMGGPVALTALRESGRLDFAGFVAIATSAYWVRPRHQIMVATAPYLLAPTSPVLMGVFRAELRREPEQAGRIAWRYAVRPSRRVLEETAAELRRFDARKWADLNLPPATWLVTLEDGVMAPAHQRASARHFGIPTVDLPSDHPVVIRAPAAVADILERSAEAFAASPPIGIRRRASRPSSTASP